MVVLVVVVVLMEVMLVVVVIILVVVIVLVIVAVVVVVSLECLKATEQQALGRHYDRSSFQFLASAQAGTVALVKTDCGRSGAV